MREDQIFSAEEMKLFREVDRETALEREQEADTVAAPPVPRSPIAPQHDLDAKHAADWDRYVQSHIQKQWDDVYSPAVTEAMCEYVAKHLSGLRSEITALREQLVQARLRQSGW
jgi:hypothetical protein